MTRPPPRRAAVVNAESAQPEPEPEEEEEEAAAAGVAVDDSTTRAAKAKAAAQATERLLQPEPRQPSEVSRPASPSRLGGAE